MRRLATFSVAGIVCCLVASATLGLQESGTETSNLQARRAGPRGSLIVEVLEIHDGSPVAGIPVELQGTGRSGTTNEDGRVLFTLAPGAYEVHVHELAGPGPALRSEDRHVVVTRDQSVVVQVFNCGICL